MIVSIENMTINLGEVAIISEIYLHRHRNRPCFDIYLKAREKPIQVIHEFKESEIASISPYFWGCLLTDGSVVRLSDIGKYRTNLQEILAVKNFQRVLDRLIDKWKEEIHPSKNYQS